MNSVKKPFLLLFSLAVFAMIASFLPPFSDLISMAANNLWPYPGEDIRFDYFVGALLGLICGLAIVFGPFPNHDRATLLYCWTAKFGACLILLPIYEFAYGMDIDGYFFFDEMPEGSAESPLGDGTWNVRLFAWMMFQVIGPSYHGGKMLFCFIGLIGIYLGYRGAVHFFNEERPRLLVLMALVPTSIFWTAALGKDPLSLLGVGIYIYGSFHWLKDFKGRHAIMVLGGIALISVIRIYFVPILGIPIVIAFLFQTRRPLARLFLTPVVVWGFFQSISQFKSAFRIESFDAFMVYQAGVASGWAGGSSFSLPAIDSPVKLALVAPLAIFTALFRPTLLEAHNAFALAAAMDNTVLLVLFFYAFARSRFREIFQPELIWMISFVSMWSLMYGIGTGNLGAISRFKVQILPIFIILLVYMARKRASVKVQGT